MATVEDDIFDILDQLIRRLNMFSCLANDKKRASEIIKEVVTRATTIMTEVNQIMTLCDEFDKLTEVK